MEKEPTKACCAPAPDRSGRTCDKPAGHSGEHWTYGGATLRWPLVMTDPPVPGGKEMQQEPEEVMRAGADNLASTDIPTAPTNEVPRRIQRQRTKGWRMPANAIYVGRPTKWGNAWRVGELIDRERHSGEQVTPQYAVEMFRYTTEPIPGRHGFVTDYELNEIDLRPLRGKDLACWCPLDQPCHADVLLELANSPAPTVRS
jgi:hypothetical protein